MILTCMAAAAQPPASNEMLRSYLQSIAMRQLNARKEAISAIQTRE